MSFDTRQRSVALVTLGCTRNEVDSEELAGRLAAEGWLLVDDAADADVAVVNTCGFVAQAKKDSIDALLEASDLKARGAPRRSSLSGASPSGTATSWPPSCPRPTPCSASTPTPTCRPTSVDPRRATPPPRTCRRTGARCCRSRRRTARHSGPVALPGHGSGPDFSAAPPVMSPSRGRSPPAAPGSSGPGSTAVPGRR